MQKLILLGVFLDASVHGARDAGIQWFGSERPAAVESLSADTDNVCQAAGFPCFTPNAKDVNASSLLHTCGPVYNGIFGCQDLQIAGYKCFYNYTMYTCDQGHDPVHDGDSGEECLQGSYDKCNTFCTKLDSSYQHTCTNFCKRACKIA
jgi:hypothetical protein